MLKWHQMKKIFVAATGQHVGKTTSTLGLVANLQEQGFTTGYCKPVGQKSVFTGGMTADKDAVLFAKVIGFNMDPDIHSPVILGKGVTADYIENPSLFDFPKRILHAADVLESNFDVVVYEGTGHPGVGSVVDLSNADVASMLNSGVIMIVEGGIGSTIDKLNMSIALFKAKNVPIHGVIVNKVKEDKYEKVNYYLGKKLAAMGIPLLGILPYDESLSFPIMETIQQAVDGKIIMNEEGMGNRVEDLLAGSLIHVDEFNTFSNTLLVVSHKRLYEAISKIEEIIKLKNLKESPLSGVIVTGDGRHASWFDNINIECPLFDKYKIPVIATTLDTYGSFLKINRIEVKINTQTPWKSARAIELIREHVNFDLLIEKFDLNHNR